MKRREFIINSALALGGAFMLSGCNKNEIVSVENQISKRKFKDMLIPLMGFGTMRLPMKDKTTVDVYEVEKMVDYAIAHGANYFDTAYMYVNGKSENVMGKILKQYNRKDIIISDKAPVVFMKTKDDVKRIFEEQLKKKVNTDYFDFYMVHNINKDTIDNYRKFEIYDQIMDFKRQGLVKNVGFSFHGTVDMIKEVVHEHNWDFCLLQVNYFDWNSAVNSKEQCEIVQKHNIPYLVMEPLRGGNLCNLKSKALDVFKENIPNESQASYGLRWVASQKGILSVLSGMSSLEQIKENIATFTNFKPLTKQELEASEKIVNAIKEQSAIACTTCRYCTEVCPRGIAIPEIFSLYNTYKNDKNKWLFNTYYQAIPEDKRLDKCIKCGLCNKNCPQHLDIPNLLQKIADEMKNMG